MMILLTGLLVSGFWVSQSMTLESIEIMVAEKFAVAEISQTALQARLRDDPSELMVFDTRPREEFDVGHLKQAIQVDPDLSAEEFERRFGPLVNGKTLVFYCSVGYRSSQLLERVTPLLRQRNVQSAANLRGGIFRWHNEGRPVFDAQGLTEKVHPYSDYWGQLLTQDPKRP